MPAFERANFAAVRVPVRLKVRVTAKAEWSPVDGLWGDTQFKNGRKTASEVKRADGRGTGKLLRNGESRDGEEAWAELVVVFVSLRVFIELYAPAIYILLLLS